jgi:hypothetical protein
MKRPYYHSEALPISWEYKDYMPNHNEYVQVKPKKEYPEMSVQEAFDFVRSDDKHTKLKDGKNFIPSGRLYVNTPDGGKVWFSEKGGFTRSEMMIMEMLSTNNWERPMYFCTTVGNSYYLGLEPYMELTGLAYRITPYRSRDGQPRVNSEKMYDNMMNKFQYGNVKAKGIYLDENTMRMCETHRTMFARLAEQLLYEQQYDKAQAVLARCEEELPSYNVPYGEYSSAVMVGCYYELAHQLEKAGRLDEAQEAADQGYSIVDQVGENVMEYVYFVQSLTEGQAEGLDLSDIGRKASILQYMIYTVERAGNALTDEQEATLSLYVDVVEQFETYRKNPAQWIKNKQKEEEAAKSKKSRSY